VVSATEQTVSQEPGVGGASVVLAVDAEDELDAALATERASRSAAEARAAELDERLARLAVETRDLTRLRDNFHSLYREERELRTAAEEIADQRSQERDELQQQVILLSSDVERLDRQVTRLQQARAAVQAATPTAAAEVQPTAEAPSTADGPAPHDTAGDARLVALEQELGALHAHAADVELALTQRAADLAAAGQRVSDLEREVTAARAQLSEAPTAQADVVPAAESAAATRRLHELDGELATLRAEHADLRAAHDRAAAARDGLQAQLHTAQEQRGQAERFAATAEQRVEEALLREQEAVREAQTRRAQAERAELELQAAKASIGVLEQRVRDAEAARDAAEQRAAALEQELDVVRSEMLTGRPAAAKRTLLRRRPAGTDRGKADAVPHMETVGTAVNGGPPLEVAGAPEDVESILHRRLFGD
jgi:chromosome segregation ATPase